jgi:hypothetical protein
MSMDDNVILVRREAWFAIRRVKGETCVFFRDREKALKFGLALAAKNGVKLLVEDKSNG